MSKTFFAAVVAGVVLFVAGLETADARPRISVSFNSGYGAPCYNYGYAPSYRYYAPAPVYYRPAHVYYRPVRKYHYRKPVYYAPPRVYSGRRVIYYTR